MPSSHDGVTLAAVAFSKKVKTFKAETLYRMGGRVKLLNYFSGKCLLFISSYWMFFVCVYRENKEKAVLKQMWCLTLSFLRCDETAFSYNVLANSSMKHNSIWSCCYRRICLKTLTFSYCSALYLHLVQ